VLRCVKGQASDDVVQRQVQRRGDPLQLVDRADAFAGFDL